MKKEVVVVHLSVIHLRDRLQVPRKVRALHSEQLIVLRKVLQLAPRLALGRTHKQLRSRGLSELACVCFLIRFVETPHAVVQSLAKKGAFDVN